MLLGIIIVVIALLGLIITCSFLITGILNRNKAKLRTSGIVFVSTFVGVIGLIYLSETFFQPKYKDEKDMVLIGIREASIGGIRLNLYKDKTFDLGTLDEIVFTGNYQVKNDTIALLSKDSLITLLIINDNEIIEVKKRKFGFLHIYKKGNL